MKQRIITRCLDLHIRRACVGYETQQQQRQRLKRGIQLTQQRGWSLFPWNPSQEPFLSHHKRKTENGFQYFTVESMKDDILFAVSFVQDIYFKQKFKNTFPCSTELNCFIFSLPYVYEIYKFICVKGTSRFMVKYFIFQIKSLNESSQGGGGWGYRTVVCSLVSYGVTIIEYTNHTYVITIFI